MNNDELKKIDEELIKLKAVAYDILANMEYHTKEINELKIQLENINSQISLQANKKVELKKEREKLLLIE